MLVYFYLSLTQTFMTQLHAQNQQLFTPYATLIYFTTSELLQTKGHAVSTLTQTSSFL